MSHGHPPVGIRSSVCDGIEWRIFPRPVGILAARRHYHVTGGRSGCATLGYRQVEVLSPVKDLRSFQALALDTKGARDRPGLKDLARRRPDGESIGREFQHVATVEMEKAPTISGNVRRIDGTDFEVGRLAPWTERIGGMHDVQLV